MYIIVCFVWILLSFSIILIKIAIKYWFFYVCYPKRFFDSFKAFPNFISGKKTLKEFHKIYGNPSNWKVALLAISIRSENSGLISRNNFTINSSCCMCHIDHSVMSNHFEKMLWTSVFCFCLRALIFELKPDKRLSKIHSKWRRFGWV